MRAISSAESGTFWRWARSKGGVAEDLVFEAGGEAFEVGQLLGG
jgi:hypothetical protein